MIKRWVIFQQDPDFSFGLKWSILGHLILLFTILIKGLVFPGKPLPYIPTLKVDLVGLPDVLKKDLPTLSQIHLNHEISQVLKQAEQNAKKIKAHSIKDQMSLQSKTSKEKSNHPEDSVGKKNKRALERLKALTKIQDFPESPPMKGNQISPGSNLSGEARESAQANYYDILQDKVKAFWTLPPWIARQNLTAQVALYIDSRGNLHQIKFVKTSGNTQFDDAVKRAIQEGQPFPAPPKELGNSLLNDGILLGFPL